MMEVDSGAPGADKEGTDDSEEAGEAPTDDADADPDTVLETSSCRLCLAAVPEASGEMVAAADDRPATGDTSELDSEAGTWTGHRLHSERPVSQYTSTMNLRKPTARRLEKHR